MKYLLIALYLIVAPLAAQYSLSNLKDCEADHVIVADEDGKLSCAAPGDITAGFKELGFVTVAETGIQWPEAADPVEWPATTLGEIPKLAEDLSSLAFPEIVTAETGLLLRMDGTWQLVVNGDPYVCFPEEDRK